MTAMTTTILAPITLDTACPSWCTEHKWFEGDEGRVARHEAPVMMTYPPAEPGTGDREFTVTPSRIVIAGEPVETSVYFNDWGDGILATGAEVAEVVAALLEAGRLAFGATIPSRHEESTPAIRRILAERAVLDAVRDWIDGDGRTTAVENAYAQLAAARDEAAG